MKLEKALPLTQEQWAIGLAGLGLAIFLVWTTLDPGLLVKKTKGTGLRVGSVLDVSITLVTTDVAELACASDAEVAGAKCQFDAYGALRTPDERPAARAELFAPYMTTDNVLFLVRGMFAEPAVAKRLVDEPPGSLPKGEQVRFVAACKLTLEGRVTELGVRWEKGAAFGPREPAWAGRVSECSVTNY